MLKKDDALVSTSAATAWPRRAAFLAVDDSAGAEIGVGLTGLGERGVEARVDAAQTYAKAVGIAGIH